MVENREFEESNDWDCLLLRNKKNISLEFEHKDKDEIYTQIILSKILIWYSVLSVCYGWISIFSRFYVIH